MKEAVQLALKQNPQRIIAQLLVSESDRNSQIARSALLPQAGIAAEGALMPRNSNCPPRSKPYKLRARMPSRHRRGSPARNRNSWKPKPANARSPSPKPYTNPRLLPWNAPGPRSNKRNSILVTHASPHRSPARRRSAPWIWGNMFRQASSYSPSFRSRRRQLRHNQLGCSSL